MDALFAPTLGAASGTITRMLDNADLVIIGGRDGGLAAHDASVIGLEKGATAAGRAAISVGVVWAPGERTL
jgi:hypothetical protein